MRMNIQKADSRRELSKKPYSAPALQVYGDLVEIAGSVGNLGLGDGGVTFSKTH